MKTWDPISRPGGTGQRKRHRTGSRGVTARQEPAGRASRAGGPCGAGLGEAAGGEWCGGPRRSWVGQSCSRCRVASHSQGARPGGAAGGGPDVERSGLTRWLCWAAMAGGSDRWWQSGEGGTGWRRDSVGCAGGQDWSRLWAWRGRRWRREAELGEELGAECRNSARHCGGFDLRELDARQTQPETAAGRLVQVLRRRRRRRSKMIQQLENKLKSINKPNKLTQSPSANQRQLNSHTSWSWNRWTNKTVETPRLQSSLCSVFWFRSTSGPTGTWSVFTADPS